MKQQVLKIKEWIAKHPVAFFWTVMTVLILSFAGSIIKYYCFPSKMEFTTTPPPAFSEENNTKQKSKNNMVEMGKIVKELESYKDKRDKGHLTKSDSLRIDYLFNQYQKLK
jgi:hypothetical protein